MFCTRYLDLITGPWHSLYNVLMKVRLAWFPLKGQHKERSHNVKQIFFIASSFYIIYLMQIKFKFAFPSPQCVVPFR